VCHRHGSLQGPLRACVCVVTVSLRVGLFCGAHDFKNRLRKDCLCFSDLSTIYRATPPPSTVL
jgi:hypothetical protein